MHPHRELVLIGLALSFALVFVTMHCGNTHHALAAGLIGVLTGIVFAVSMLAMWYPNFNHEQSN